MVKCKLCLDHFSVHWTSSGRGWGRTGLGEDGEGRKRKGGVERVVLTEDREVCAGLGAGQAEPGGRADGDLPGLCSLLFPGGGPLLTLSLRPMALR